MITREKKREHNQRYNSSEKGKAARKRAYDKWNGTEERKESQKKYSKTDKGKAARDRANKKYYAKNREEILKRKKENYQRERGNN